MQYSDVLLLIAYRIAPDACDIFLIHQPGSRNYVKQLQQGTSQREMREVPS